MINSIECPITGLNCESVIFQENRELCYYDDSKNFDYYISIKAKSEITKNDVSLNLLQQCRKVIFDCYKENTIPMFLKDQADKQDNHHDRVKRYYLNEVQKYEVLHSGKAEQLLEIHANKKRILGPFESHKFTVIDMYQCLILNHEEMKEWVRLLIHDGLLCSNSGEFELLMDDTNLSQGCNVFKHLFKITTAGWSHIEESQKGVNSNKVFIAMSFGIKDRDAIQGAIERACNKFGYQGRAVDNEHYQGGVTDKIISLINSSKFVVSDFTENKHGVYYEAGYAEGMNKTVIYTVKDGKDLENLHFDTKHLNYIPWKDYDDLEEKLTNRIGALSL